MVIFLRFAYMQILKSLFRVVNSVRNKDEKNIDMIKIRRGMLDILPSSVLLHALNFRVSDVSPSSVLQYVFKHAECS